MLCLFCHDSLTEFQIFSRDAEKGQNFASSRKFETLLRKISNNSQTLTNAHKQLTNAHKRPDPLSRMTPSIGTHFKVGDRALYEDEWGQRVVTINGINTNVPAGEEPDISIQMGPGDPAIRDTVLRRLTPYETPAFPPGILLTDPKSIHQQDEIDEFMEGLLGEEELKVLNEMNEDTIAEIMTDEARDYALPEMSTEMDSWEDIGNMKENYHRLLARSKQGHGVYLGNRSVDEEHNRRWVSSHEPRESFAHEGLEELDIRDRILVEAVVNKKGHKYVNLVCDYGKIFCDLKFTKYLPKEGEKVNCVVGLRGPESKLPWKCYHIPQ